MHYNNAVMRVGPISMDFLNRLFQKKILLAKPTIEPLHRPQAQGVNSKSQRCTNPLKPIARQLESIRLAFSAVRFHRAGIPVFCYQIALGSLSTFEYWVRRTYTNASHLKSH